MAKPTVRHIGAFDAALDHTIQFDWSGRSSTNCHIWIYNQISNALVYEKSVASTLSTYTIPSGTLTNGTRYYLQIQLTDTAGTVSETSDNSFFSCYSTPTLSFVGVDNPWNTDQRSNTITLSYSQAEGRSLLSYACFLYDVNKSLIFESDTIYDQSLTYTFRGLNDNTKYYIQAQAESVDGMSCKTELLSLNINTDQQEYYVFAAENDFLHGWIKYYSNIITIEYRGDAEIVVKDGKAYANTEKLYYDNGFDLSGDFTAKLDVVDLVSSDNPFLEMNNGTDYIYLYYQESPNPTTYAGNVAYRFKLVVTNGQYQYVIYSNAIQALDNTITGNVTIRRKDNLYQIYGTDLSTYTMVGIEPILTENSIDIYDEDRETLLTEIGEAKTVVQSF